ncbi:E3 ubiquitin-protein ligase ptr1 (HECT-type E3 ubiquitin transferase ptr1) (Poly(A)+ RNA transport protein 1) [Durusdinium trenchii]|uniref:HECT-type E3 ubiquitin transferase n=1 Tax=Durusdinium trenchii TaxID=1381693 RepID=A0ABP0SMM5_9DINO
MVLRRLTRALGLGARKVGAPEDARGSLVLESQDDDDGDDSGLVVLAGGDRVRQKVSVHHVTNNIYYSAPVRVSKISDDKEYIWIELDEKAIDAQKLHEEYQAQGEDDWEKHKQMFPPGVSVDNVGNIFVAAVLSTPKGSAAGAGGGTPSLNKPRRISGDDVMASFKAPERPAAPELKHKTAESIEITWPHVLGLVDYYEVQYLTARRHCDKCLQAQAEARGLCCDTCASLGHQEGSTAKRGATSWETLGNVSADHRHYTLENVYCGLPYHFRVRAHNTVDWGPFSEPNQDPIETLPEPPSAPEAPKAQRTMVRTDRILLQWVPPRCNGRPVLGYEVVGGQLNAETVDTVYQGADTHVLLKDLAKGTQLHFKVRARNEMGMGPFGEYGTFRTLAQDQAQEGKGNVVGEFVPDWAQVFDSASQQEAFINVLTEKLVFERPAAMDGPVDPVVEFKKKRFRFNRELLRDAPKGAAQVLRFNIDRENLLWDSFHQFMSVSDYAQLRKRIKVDYVGQEGIDAGGLSKDWFLEISRVIFSPKTGLFTRLGEGNALDIRVSAPGPARPDESQNTVDQVDQLFHFVGRFLGKAIYDRQLVDVQLSKTLFKQLFGKPVDVEDLRETDPTLVKSLEWMLENDIDGILFEEFCVTADPPPGSASQEKVIIDLVSGGRNIEVSNENKAEYVDKMIQWRAVESCKRQIEAIQYGLYEMIPFELLSSIDFELNELEMLWNGLPFIDVQQIRNTCRYQGGIDTNSPIAHWFWKFFKCLETDDQAKLLRFATGTSKVPVDGMEPPFNLTYNDQLDPEALPKAHTCFNQLVLPPYATEDMMADKLRFAMDNADGFLLG